MIADVEPERGLGHMSISQLTLTSSDEEPARRFEVFTGSGRRREWSDERNAAIVAESYEPGVTVCAVACRGARSPAAYKPALSAHWACRSHPRYR
ncbi:transposase [Rhizobium pusense]|nr:transposase [Agrobacterium pusense]